MSNAILRLKNVTFSYGNSVILDDVGTAIHEGDFLGIVGPNGSGKSTLLKICLGMIKPQKGSIEIFDTPINRFKGWGKIGYIPQKATAFNQGFPATVEEVVKANLYPIIGLAGRAGKKHKAQVDEALDTVGMKDYKQRLVGRLSGGQQQRVFIAKALVSAPRIIFMDEPTVGIDSKSEESFYELMETLNKRKNITLVMVTHDIGAIDKRINRILCLSDGKILEHQCSSETHCDIYSEAYGKHAVNPIKHNHGGRDSNAGAF